MRPFQPTIIATVVVAALAAFSIYDYKKNGEISNDTKAGEQKTLFKLVKEDVQKIVLTRPAEGVELVRVGQEWRVTKPLEDLAETGAIESFLYLALAQKGKVFRGPDDGTPNWAEFGLDPGLGSIELQGRDEAIKVLVSSKNAFDGSYYLRLNDEVLLGDRGMAQIADRQANSFRSRRLWRKDDVPIQSVEVELDYLGVKKKMKLTVEASQWKLTPAVAFPLDHERIDHWVKRMQNLIPSEIVKDEITEETKKEFLLSKPSMIVKLNFGDQGGESWTLTVGQDRAEEVFVYTDVRPTIYKSGTAALRQIRAGPEFFRDGRAPFKFEMEKVTQVEVSQPQFNHLFKKDVNDWAFAGDDKTVKVDPEKLKGFFQNLGTLEAHEFVTGRPAGFKPTHRAVLKDAQGKVVYEVSWGGAHKSSLPQNQGIPLQLVKASLSDSLVAVPAEKLAALLSQPLIQMPEKPIAPPNPEDDHHNH